MPIDYNNYPRDWKQISQRIRDREADKCKWCGAPNHTYIVRSNIEPAHYLIFDEAHGGYQYSDGQKMPLSEIPEEYCDFKHVRVVLTCAHLDHDVGNNSDENLAALCQLCHNRYDNKMRVGHARITRMKKKQEAINASGQLNFLADLIERTE